jgi:hypothetical protein
METTSFENYLIELPEDRKQPIKRLRDVLSEKLPEGFAERFDGKFLHFEVPLSLYSAGYHVNKQPLMFIALASQKNFIALYHMGMYDNAELLKWFIGEYPKHSKNKLDMGKCCIRFKNINQIPYDLIEEMATKVTPQQWIEQYEESLKKN